MWAILGRRSPDERALTWRQSLASHVEFMGKVNYPRKTRLRRDAAKAGVEIAFLEKQELRDFGNAGRLVSRAKRLGLGRLLAGFLAPFTQRYMVLIAPPGKKHHWSAVLTSRHQSSHVSMHEDDLDTR
jgi:hypothetical protein